MDHVIKNPNGGFFVDYRDCNRAEWGSFHEAHRFHGPGGEKLAERIAEDVGGFVYAETEIQDHEISAH